MNTIKKVFLVFNVHLLCATFLFSQSYNFDISAYKQFLTNNSDVTWDQLLQMHPAGLFEKNIDSRWDAALYHDSLEIKYELTDDELSLIKKHGFVVTSRLRQESFGAQFLDIYHKDLPVFISTDAILYAFHASYDRLLLSVEVQYLIPKLQEFLAELHSLLPALAVKYQAFPAMQQMINDVDIYLTIPRKLLNSEISPFYEENTAEIDRLLALIEAQSLANTAIFSETPRKIDFSQFKPRGHYTDPYNTILADYFKAMIWLGRIELYLIPPRSLDQKPSFSDMRRQIIAACIIQELVESAENSSYEDIEKVLSFFVGAQDNVTLDNLTELKSIVPFSTPADLLDSLKIIDFQSQLAQQPYAQQRILSQVLMNDPMNPDSIVPASAFLLFGQRFIIDSYITGNVVWDRIKTLRMLPNTLDIMFALGNDAALQLLQPEINSYAYAPQLAALRYLVSSYEQDFWQSTIYNMWLQAIRTLNPAEKRTDLPPFMHTAAWWQQKLNTQLASWTELRHDNLLYAKQSYTGGVVCSYPYSYVEPIPAFYASLKASAQLINEHIRHLPFKDEYFTDYVTGHFTNWQMVMDTLAGIAQKELNGSPFSADEIRFLKNMLSEEMVCGGIYNGWYAELFYFPWEYEEGLLKKDYLVADYHTAPTNESGAFVGWVAHSGTGPVEMAILNAKLPSGESIAFAGPVASYYEYTTTNFLRLTDEEWKDTYLNKALRPNWTRLYLTDYNGQISGTGPSLLTSTGDPSEPGPKLPETYLVAINYPNPFNNETIIQYSIPRELSNKTVKLVIYDITGRKIANLVDNPLPVGNYITRWNGRDGLDNEVATGIYFYSLQAGEQRFVGKMQLIK